MNNLAKKINNFFEEIKCPIEYLLKNKDENPMGTDLIGEEIDLPQYALIYNGRDITRNARKYKRFCKFREENNLELNYFNKARCKSVEGLLKELQSEGYEIILEKK